MEISLFWEEQAQERYQSHYAARQQASQLIHRLSPAALWILLYPLTVPARRLQPGHLRRRGTIIAAILMLQVSQVLTVPVIHFLSEQPQSLTRLLTIMEIQPCA